MRRFIIFVIELDMSCGMDRQTSGVSARGLLFMAARFPEAQRLNDREMKFSVSADHARKSS